MNLVECLCCKLFDLVCDNMPTFKKVKPVGKYVPPKEKPKPVKKSAYLEMVALVKEKQKPSIMDEIEAKNKEQKYGWFSKNHGCRVVYRTLNGGEILLSMVSSSDTKHGTQWTDVKCVGPVGEFIRVA